MQALLKSCFCGGLPQVFLWEVSSGVLQARNTEAFQALQKSSSSTPPTLPGTSDFLGLLLLCIAELYFSGLAKLLNFSKHV